MLIFLKIALVNLHLLNLVAAALEIILGRVPMFYSQWPAPLAIAILYMFWTLMNHVTFSPFVGNELWVLFFYNFI